MAKTKISEFNSNPALNTDIDSINIAEGCSPSGINDAIRELMSQLKDWQSGTSNDPYVVGSSGSLTLNQGTANGVAYLNGSKVVTSGTALVFDGTKLGVGTTSPEARLEVRGADAAARFRGSSIQFLDVIATSGGAVKLDANNGNAFVFSQNTTEQMRLNSSGNLGIGTSTPYSKLDLGSYGHQNQLSWHQDSTTSYGHIGIQNNSAAIALMAGLKMGSTSNSFASSISSEWAKSAVLLNYGNIQFFTNTADTVSYGTTYTPTERARIDSSGNFLVGVTSTTPGNARGFSVTSVGAGEFRVFHSTSDGSGDLFGRFIYNGSQIGSISQSGTTAVLFNTTSDQRLKENIQDADSASALIDSLQVRQFDWKTDGSHQRYGFVAQELVTVAPEAVHQPEDAEEMMAVDYSKLVPMLVKEVQSLRARVAQLESN